MSCFWLKLSSRYEFQASFLDLSRGALEFRDLCLAKSLVGISIQKLCIESLCLNRKAYILKLFIGLVCAGRMYCFLIPKEIWWRFCANVDWSEKDWAKKKPERISAWLTSAQSAVAKTSFTIMIREKPFAATAASSFTSRWWTKDQNGALSPKKRKRQEAVLECQHPIPFTTKACLQP